MVLGKQDKRILKHHKPFQGFPEASIWNTHYVQHSPGWPVHITASLVTCRWLLPSILPFHYLLGDYFYCWCYSVFPPQGFHLWGLWNKRCNFGKGTWATLALLPHKAPISCPESQLLWAAEIAHPVFTDRTFSSRFTNLRCLTGPRGIWDCDSYTLAKFGDEKNNYCP